MTSTESLPFVTDEAAFFAEHVHVPKARVVELGCGKAEFARTLLQRGLAQSVIAFEVDRMQHAANLAAPPTPGLRLEAGGAEAIPLPDACADVVVMLKSLHHVPVPMLDRALAEIARVLVPGGVLYVSEPVYAGEFNDLVKRFHDEGEVRAAAHAALQRAAREGVLAWDREIVFDTPLAFRDFADFSRRIIQATHSDHALDPVLLAEVEQHFERHRGAEGARFVRQMRVNLLVAPGAAGAEPRAEPAARTA